MWQRSEEQPKNNRRSGTPRVSFKKWCWGLSSSVREFKAVPSEILRRSFKLETGVWGRKRGDCHRLWLCLRGKGWELLRKSDEHLKSSLLTNRLILCPNCVRPLKVNKTLRVTRRALEIDQPTKDQPEFQSPESTFKKIWAWLAFSCNDSSGETGGSLESLTSILCSPRCDLIQSWALKHQQPYLLQCRLSECLLDG